MWTCGHCSVPQRQQRVHINCIIKVKWGHDTQFKRWSIYQRLTFSQFCAVSFKGNYDKKSVISHMNTIKCFVLINSTELCNVHWLHWRRFLFSSEVTEVTDSNEGMEGRERERGRDVQMAPASRLKWLNTLYTNSLTFIGSREYVTLDEQKRPKFCRRLSCEYVNFVSCPVHRSTGFISS